MRYQDHMIDVTRKAADEFFRYARAVPADRLEWKPLDNGRSVLDLARELARTPVWACELLSGADTDWSEEGQAKEMAIIQQWTTVEECEAECRKQLDRLYEVFRGIGDEKLSETKWLPFEGGRDYTFAEMMDYPRWNFTYHTGQISYIQMLYGDRDMH